MDVVQPEKKKHKDSVTEEEDGSVIITRVEFNPTSSAVNVFGVGMTEIQL